jgi:hypothetical protein
MEVVQNRIFGASHKTDNRNICKVEPETFVKVVMLRTEGAERRREGKGRDEGRRKGKNGKGEAWELEETKRNEWEGTGGEEKRRENRREIRS